MRSARSREAAVPLPASVTAARGSGRGERPLLAPDPAPHTWLPWPSLVAALALCGGGPLGPGVAARLRGTRSSSPGVRSESGPRLAAGPVCKAPRYPQVRGWKLRLTWNETHPKSQVQRVLTIEVPPPQIGSGCPSRRTFSVTRFQAGLGPARPDGTAASAGSASPGSHPRGLTRLCSARCGVHPCCRLWSGLPFTAERGPS